MATAEPLQLIAYYRVSTARQGESGLGLEAQRAKVAALAEQRGAVVVAEFTEVESGRKADRPQLAAAMADARRRGAVVAVAKLDRLARDAELVLRLSREAERNGFGGLLFADLDVDASTAAGRTALDRRPPVSLSRLTLACALGAALCAQPAAREPPADKGHVALVWE